MSPLHPVGRYKALFFKGIGYSSTVLDLLIDDFRNIAPRFFVIKSGEKREEFFERGEIIDFRIVARVCFNFISVFPEEIFFVFKDEHFSRACFIEIMAEQNFQYFKIVLRCKLKFNRREQFNDVSPRLHEHIF